MNKKEMSVMIGFMLSIVVAVFVSANVQSDKVRENTLRLHIIAADESDENVQIKTAVAEKVKQVCQQYSGKATSFEQVLHLTQKNMEYIKSVANRELLAQGADYSASCSIENFYFDTTEYKNITIPAGEYTALVVRLGQAEGKNWWCIMYPEIAAGCCEESDDTENVLWENDTHRIKLKAVEIWQGAKQYFKNVPKYDRIA